MMILFVSRSFHYLRKFSQINLLKKHIMDTSKKEAKIKEEKVLTTKVFCYIYLGNKSFSQTRIREIP